MVIAAGCAVPGNRVGGILAHAPAVWLGDRSYSLYLWHWPVLMFGFAWGLQGNVSATVGLLGLAVLLAIASYRWVELPFWKGRFSRQTALRSIVYAVSCIAVVGVSTTELIALMHDEEQRVAQFAREVRNDIPSIYVQGCDSWFRDSDLEPCAVGDASAARTAVLIGDSVGVHWYSLLPAVFKSPDWRIVVLTKSACAMVDEDYVYPVAGGVYAVCTEWRNKALDYLDRLRPDVVFVGSASTYEFNERQWVEGSKRVLARLAAGAGQVVLIAGTPMLSFDGPGCLERWMRDHGGAETPPADLCSEPLQGKSSTIVTPWLARAAAGFSNVTLLDLNDLVCPRGRCAARQVDGVVVFRDQRHLTDSFVRARAGEFARRLDGLGLTDRIWASR
jgi:hypothetical protein